ncbi:hypothetical protein BBK82_05650 [Lentzea guizhouensis]|uniref:O-methyltransferase C-terminal domain-containing protein n=1 Tax=Lentzea guizhouensis TaxID=1586287 RepID=A0A1B2HD52_9PSEU|nr:methyltransferase [Lentzea guizhouensis]ANZ35638.1 hypothetical protein BBK82_05650 [Lentzea guizhouensis]
MTRHAALDHAALLIFPETLSGLADELARHGLDVGAMTPSVVVRERLSSRYGVPLADLEVGILLAPVADRTGRPCELEIFVLVTPPELAPIAEDERRHERENHVALAVRRPDPVLVRGLRTLLTSVIGPDGGGYNGYEDNTVLYFRDAHRADPAFRRLELTSTGRFPQLLATHRRESCAGTSLLRLFTGVTKVADFTTARTVVDIAGGNGELLARVLHTAPWLHGVLLDLPNALDAASVRLAGLDSRVSLVPGDFTRAVPDSGDVYLLSRVLHDWDDDQCRTILTTCARDMPAHAELLVIERLLPDGPDDSLAIPWDVHMLCNTGGRERTEPDYRALLAEAGFELVETCALPLDA